MESTLSLKLSDLEAEVGMFLGYGRGANFSETAWSTSQQAVITSCVKSGLRQFYFPPLLEGQSQAYDWSFLRPSMLLTLDEGASSIDLPDDFGGIEGQLTLSDENSRSFWPIAVYGGPRVRQALANYPDTTGCPVMAGLEAVRGTSPTAGQRQTLLFYPTADQAYSVRLNYYVLPDFLTGDMPYALGGMAHAETVLESCLAIAEQRVDDASTVHTMKFKERLAASISLDRRSKPQVIGYNADRSDGKHWPTRRAAHGWPTVITFDGVEP